MDRTKKSNLNQSEKGITLIALVVTIIVLIILALIGINAIIDENGIIRKAEESKNGLEDLTQDQLTNFNELFEEMQDKEIQIILDENVFTYDATEKRPKVTVMLSDDIILKENEDYVVSYINNVNAGMARVTITGDKIGSQSIDFLIKKATAKIIASDATKVNGTAEPRYNGSISGLIKENDLGFISYYRTNTEENVGTYVDVITASYTENSNYDVIIKKGTFTITAAPVTPPVPPPIPDPSIPL